MTSSNTLLKKIIGVKDVECISRSLYDLEPGLSRRLDGLVHIGIDETSY